MTNKRGRDNVIARIQALMQKTVENGCTPGEAEKAAAKVEELLSAYQLSAFDVESKTFGEEVVEEEIEVRQKVWPTWLTDLAHHISRGYGCEMIMARRWEKNQIERRILVIGVESDAKVARYMIDTLSDPLFNLATVEGRRAGCTRAALVRYRNSFINGAAWAIRNRLKKMRQPDDEIEGSTANALVEVKGAMVT